jgi:hypothetical protein
MRLSKSSTIYGILHFLHPSFFVRLGIPFLRPDPHVLEAGARRGCQGRPSLCAASLSIVSRPALIDPSTTARSLWSEKGQCGGAKPRTRAPKGLSFNSDKRARGTLAIAAMGPVKEREGGGGQHQAMRPAKGRNCPEPTGPLSQVRNDFRNRTRRELRRFLRVHGTSGYFSKATIAMAKRS